MIKNILLLVAFIWVGQTMAESNIAKETIEEAETFKLEKAQKDIDAQRSVAGEKIKKAKKSEEPRLGKDDFTDELDSEVRYWEYSE